MADRPSLSLLGQTPENSSLFTRPGDLRHDLERALANEDPAAARTALLPALHRLAGLEWDLVVNDKRMFHCDYDARQVVLGTNIERGLSLEARAAYLEMVFLHELGHILFTPDDLGDEALLDFTRVASHNSPELLTAEFYWLDNVFTDGRLRGSISREFPDHTKAILEDGRLAVELQAGICYALSGVETPADLTSSQAFGRLEPREQVGLLMMARLNGTPDLEQPWLEAADQSVQECFSQLRPLLEATRHGQDQEYLTAQAPCFQILNESDLVPSLAVKDYHVIGAGVEHDTFVGYFTKMLVELDRPISARPASLGLDAEQLSTRLLEAKRVLLNTEKRVQLAAEVQRPVQPALAL